MTDEWLVVSNHAARRWHQRTDSPGIGPLIAWNQAERRQDTLLRGDEVRYHRHTQAYLVRREDTLVTVITDGPLVGGAR